MKKTAIIILSVVIVCALAFGGAAYYLNNPNIVVAKAFSNGAVASSYDGSMDLKISFDTSKLMAQPEISGNSFALAQIQAIKEALENSAIKLAFDGISDGKQILLNMKYTLPQEMGQSSSFDVYSDGTDSWAKEGSGSWTKAENNTSKATPEDEKTSRQAAMDFLKSCSITSSGDKITIAMNPTYNDIIKLIPQKMVDEINSTSQGQFSLEKVIDALNIQATVTIDKNSKFFIPNPSISKVDMEIKGDMSKLIPDVSGIPDEEKALYEGISFDAKGAVIIQQNDSIKVEKPAGI